jgi:chromosome segregation ATPase
LVDGDSVPGEVDDSLDELHQQVAASEEHIAKLQGALKEAADQEAKTAQQFDGDRQLRAALDQQLHQAREEASRLMLEEASQTHNTLLAEAEELLRTSRVEAEREAGQITEQAFDKANEMIALARSKATAIVDAGREDAGALEDDAARRMPDLDTKHRELTQRLGAAETKCDELRATLKLVAEISTDQLVEAGDARKQLDGVDTNGPLTEPNNEQTTSGSPPQESLPTDLDTAPRFDGNEPDSVQVEISESPEE